MGKNILLGVTGSIAAYKSCDIASSLSKKGFNVNVIMTQNAKKFMNEINFWTLTGNNVYSDMWVKPEKFDVEHISLAKMTDVLLIAPATANIIAKLANGICDDMLSTVCLALPNETPKLIAPAMNTAMLTNPATQHNIDILKKRGYIFIEPAIGMLACGDVGAGKLADVNQIVSECENILNKKKDLYGKNLIISAGATYAPIDPVRFVSNYSSGKMGVSLANEALNRGATVFFVKGITTCKDPVGTINYTTKTNEEMYEKIKELIETNNIDAFISAAAPCDFEPAKTEINKIKKSDEYTMKFKKSKDVLKCISEFTNKPILIGFAAETENLLEYATKKMIDKNLDMIIANDVSKDVFGSDFNKAYIIRKDKEMKETERIEKSGLANIILDDLVEIIGK